MSDALNLVKSRLDLYGIDPNLEAYDAYNQKSDAIDDILNSLGWYNEERASKVKKRILGEEPPNPSFFDQAKASLPGAISGIGSMFKSAGADISAPVDPAQERYESSRDRIPFGLGRVAEAVGFIEPPKVDYSNLQKAGPISQSLGDAMQSAGQFIQDVTPQIDVGRPETEEEQLQRLRESAPDSFLDRNVFLPLAEAGYTLPKSQIGASIGQSFSPTLVGGAAGLSTLALTKNPVTAASAYTAATTGSAAYQVADEVRERALHDPRLRAIVEQSVMQEQGNGLYAGAIVESETERRLEMLSKRLASEAVKRRIAGPQTLLEGGASLPIGGPLARLATDVVAGGSSEGFDELMSQQLLAEAAQSLGASAEEVQSFYDTDAIKKAVTSGAVLEVGPGVLETTYQKFAYDDRVDKERTDIVKRRDRELTNFKDAAKLRIEEEKLRQFDEQTDAQVAKTALDFAKQYDLPIPPQFQNLQQQDVPAPQQPVLDQQEVQEAQFRDEFPQEQAQGQTQQLSPEFDQRELQSRVPAGRQRISQEQISERNKPGFLQTAEERLEARERPNPLRTADALVDERARRIDETQGTDTGVEGDQTIVTGEVNETTNEGESSRLQSEESVPARAGVALSKPMTQAVVDLFKKRFPGVSQSVKNPLTGQSTERKVEVVSYDEFKRMFPNTKASEYTEGIYKKSNGDTYIIHDNIRGDSEASATERVTEVLWHEVFGHRGLQKGIDDAGGSYDNFIDKATDYFKNNEELREQYEYVRDGLDTEGLSDAEAEKLATEEFIVLKFAEGIDFQQTPEGIAEGKAYGVLENTFMEGMVAALKAGLGADGINKGRLSDKMIRRIFLKSKKDYMQGKGDIILGQGVVASVDPENDELEASGLKAAGLVRNPETRKLTLDMEAVLNSLDPSYEFNPDAMNDSATAQITTPNGDRIDILLGNPEGNYSLRNFLPASGRRAAEEAGVNLDVQFDMGDIVFSGPRGFGLTGNQEQEVVFPAVVYSLDAWLKEKKPEGFKFTSSNKTGSRARLYDKIVKIVAENNGYNFFTNFSGRSGSHYGQRKDLSEMTPEQINVQRVGVEQKVNQDDPFDVNFVELSRNIFQDSQYQQSVISGVEGDGTGSPVEINDDILRYHLDEIFPNDSEGNRDLELLQRQYIENENTNENQDRMATAIQSIRRERAQEFQRRFNQEETEINADAERLDAEPTAQSDAMPARTRLPFENFEFDTAEMAEPLFNQYLDGTIPSSEVERSARSAMIDYADTNRLSGGDLRRLAGLTNMYRNIVPANADSADPSVTEFQDAYAEGYRGAIRQLESQERADQEERGLEQDTDPPNIPQPLIDAAGELPTEQNTPQARTFRTTQIPVQRRVENNNKFREVREALADGLIGNDPAEIASAFTQVQHSDIYQTIQRPGGAARYETFVTRDRETNRWIRNPARGVTAVTSGAGGERVRQAELSVTILNALETARTRPEGGDIANFYSENPRLYAGSENRTFAEDSSELESGNRQQRALDYSMVADRSGQADMINRLLERSATDDEYDAIEMSYGLNGVPKMTSSEIAQEMNITPGEVKELVKSAERKMKNEARDMMRNDELFSRRRRLLEETPDVDGVNNINEQTFGREPEEVDTERATLMQRTLNLFPSFVRGTKGILANRMLPGLSKEQERGYNIQRYLTLGGIADTNRIAKDAQQALSKVSNPKKVYEYLTTKPNEGETLYEQADRMLDPQDREISQETKLLISEIGDDLVESGLLSQRTLKEMQGQYLPRIYLSHLLSDDVIRKINNRSLRPSDLGYLIQRQNIPKAVRELMLKEIKDPAFLAGKALSIPARDVQLIKLFDQIADNPEIAFQETVTEFDYLQEIENIVGDQDRAKEILKELELDPSVAERRQQLQNAIDNFNKELADPERDEGTKRIIEKAIKRHEAKLNAIKPRKVSGEYLIQEANRLEEQILDTLESDYRPILSDLTKKMREVGREVSVKGSNYDPNEFERVPKNKKYGRLQGALLQRDVYDDLIGFNDMMRQRDTAFNALFGEGGVASQVQKAFKFSKVAANFPQSHIRNGVSGLFTMHLSGIPFHTMPGLVGSAIKEVVQDGPHYKIAKKYGVIDTTFAAQELTRFDEDFMRLQRMINKKERHGFATVGVMTDMIKKLVNKVGDTYGMIDAVLKVAVIKDAMNRGVDIRSGGTQRFGGALDQSILGGAKKERVKLSEGDAVLRAQKYLFDYSQLPDFFRKARQAPLGPPFLTYYVKMAGIMAETIRDNPHRLVPYYLASQYLPGLVGEAFFGLEDDDVDAIKTTLPEYARNKSHMYLIPYRDENNRLQFADGSYMIPWGMFAELQNEIADGDLRSALQTLGIAGGPWPSIISAITTNVDPFTQREVVPPGAKGKDAAMSWLLYGWNLSMPTLFAGLPDLMMETRQERLQGPIRKFIGALQGDTDSRGNPKSTAMQAISQLLGLNILPVDPQLSRQRTMQNYMRQMNEQIRASREEIRNLRNRNASESKIRETQEKYRNRINEIRTEMNEFSQATERVVNL